MKDKIKKDIKKLDITEDCHGKKYIAVEDVILNLNNALSEDTYSATKEKIEKFKMYFYENE